MGNAIAEGYADVLGNLAEAYYDETVDPDWQLGEDSGHSKYSMKNPTASLIPDGYRNAGILSYGAYLMWNGTAGEGYTSQETAITDIAVLSKLWYRSLLYLHSDADFSQVADALTCASRDLVRQGLLTQSQAAGIQFVLGSNGIGLYTSAD